MKGELLNRRGQARLPDLEVLNDLVSPDSEWPITRNNTETSRSGRWVYPRIPLFDHNLRMDDASGAFV
jgi:hypothetical protein